MVLLASGFADQGYPTDFLVPDHQNLPYLQHLCAGVRLIRLSVNRRSQFNETVDYIRRESPAVLLTAKGKDDRQAVDARDASGMLVRVFLRCGSHLSSRSKMSGRNPLRRWWHAHEIRRLYNHADGVVCVSQGVADDVAAVTGLAPQTINVVRNPTIMSNFSSLMNQDNPHLWFGPNKPPVILGAGSLAAVKRFEDLIQAMAGVMEERDCRLLILGEGKARNSLMYLAESLGIADRVQMPGFVHNVLPYMRDAALFVLASEREGSPNVLTEALACGTPVVSTDCPSGPREILAGGRYGPLIPIGDISAMQQSILSTLADPLPADTLREAIAEYTLENATRGYLDAFGI